MVPWKQCLLILKHFETDLRDSAWLLDVPAMLQDILKVFLFKPLYTLFCCRHFYLLFLHVRLWSNLYTSYLSQSYGSLIQYATHQGIHVYIYIYTLVLFRH